MGSVKFKFIYLLIIACVCQACGSPSPSKADPQRLRMSINREPHSLDPRKGAEVVSAAMHFLLFEGLTRFNEDWTISLSLAEKVDISEDKTVYRFFLREAYWSDGSRITAHDFSYSWKKILDPAFPAPNAHLFYPIKNAEPVKKGLLSAETLGIRVLDDTTLQVELEGPTPYFLQLVAFCAFFPVQQNIDARNPNWALGQNSSFVCNGPFQIADWQKMQSIRLERNPHYWDKGKISLKEIDFFLLSDGMTALHLFENNQLDLIQFSLCPLPADCISFLREKEEFYTEPSAGSVFIAFNTRVFPFNNVKLRRAFGMALNRKSIIDNITQLKETPATGAVPPILKNNVRHLLIPDGPCPEAASLFREALDELGLSSAEELPRLTYLYSASDINKKTAETIQMQLSKCLGVTIFLQSMEHYCLLFALQKRDFQMVQTTWIAQYNDPMNILERFKSSENAKNYSGWEDPCFCELLAQSSLVTGDKRMEILLAAEKRLTDAMPVIPLYHLNASYLKKPYVKNLISPYSSNLCYAWISDEVLHENFEYPHRRLPHPFTAYSQPGSGR